MDFDKAIASQHRRSIVLRVFLGMSLGAVLLAIWASWLRLGFFSAFQDSGSFVAEDANFVDAFTALAAGVENLVFIGTVITWLFWFRRAYGNLAMIGHGRSEYTPGWAIGAWFIPFLNLVRPFTMTREVWANSVAAIDGSQVRRVKAPILGIWWTFWVVGNIADSAVAQMNGPGNSVDDAILVSQFGLGAGLLGLGQCITAFLVVRGIDRLQSRVGPSLDEVF